jgi:hypothetical protein
LALPAGIRLLVPDVAYFLQHEQENNLLYIYSWLRDYSKHENGVQLPRILQMDVLFYPFTQTQQA